VTHEVIYSFYCIYCYSLLTHYSLCHSLLTVSLTTHCSLCHSLLTIHSLCHSLLTVLLIVSLTTHSVTHYSLCYSLLTMSLTTHSVTYSVTHYSLCYSLLTVTHYSFVETPLCVLRLLAVLMFCVETVLLLLVANTLYSACSLVVWLPLHILYVIINWKLWNRVSISMSIINVNI